MTLVTPNKAKFSSKRAIIDRSETQVVQEFTSQSHRKEIVTSKKAYSHRSFTLQKYPTFQSFNLDADESDVVGECTVDEIEEMPLPEENIIPYSPRADVEVKYIIQENERISKIVREQVSPPPTTASH